MSWGNWLVTPEKTQRVAEDPGARVDLLCTRTTGWIRAQGERAQPVGAKCELWQLPAEDAVATGADDQTEDDEDDAHKNATSDQRDDAPDD